jgi:hypothetical protein
MIILQHLWDQALQWKRFPVCGWKLIEGTFQSDVVVRWFNVKEFYRIVIGLQNPFLRYIKTHCTAAGHKNAMTGFSGPFVLFL